MVCKKCEITSLSNDETKARLKYELARKYFLIRAKYSSKLENIFCLLGCEQRTDLCNAFLC